MKPQLATVETHGFYGAYYPAPKPTTRAIIVMLGDSSTDRMAQSGAWWVHSCGCNALAMSPAEKDYGHHNYPIERFGRAIEFLREQGNDHVGIAGASTTGMLALIAASYYPEITLTIALSPSDFVMEGFYRDGLDGAAERPGNGESTASWQGEPLPYLPFAYRHPEYDRQLKAEAKAGKDMAAARRMFDESERLHPLREEELIKVERIRGHVVFVGARDDVLWDTCRYIKRMEERLERLPHECTHEAMLFDHATHFVFPQSMLMYMVPVAGNLMTRLFRAGREHPRECRAARKAIDVHLRDVISRW